MVFPDRVNTALQQLYWSKSVRPVLCAWILVGLLAAIGLSIVNPDHFGSPETTLNSLHRSRWDSRIERAVPVDEPQRPVFTPTRGTRSVVPAT